MIQANQSADCFTLYEESKFDDGELDMIHICDWPGAKASIDAFQRGRGGKI
jgi:hypothetical protein